MRKPTIHINGTSPQALAEAYRKAREAVVEAYGAMADCAPNARDYYTQGEGAFKEAVEEYGNRVVSLKKIGEELYELLEHCLDNS